MPDRKGDESIDLYEIIRLRYERAATIITSNRDTDELHQLFGFGDPLLASAAMDRLPAERRAGLVALSLQGGEYVRLEEQ